MLFLCVSDIHGNLDALRAVLATAERRSFHKLLVAGDIVFPGPEPLETWRRLNAAGAVMVQGVTDKALSLLDPQAIRCRSEHEKRMLERMRVVRSELGGLVLERLKRLPTHQRIALEDGSELTLVHGSPAQPDEALSFDMDDDEIDALLGDECGNVVVCGMSHTPFYRMIGDVHVINVGSVGEAPDGLTASPTYASSERPTVAHATWIESTPRGISVEQITVPLEPQANAIEASL